MKVKRFFTILLFWLTLISLVGQTYQAPKLVCVKRSGLDTKLTWIPQTESCGSFIKYYIHHSNSKNGPYKIIDSISNYNSTTFTHTPNTYPPVSYYYISTLYNCPGVSAHSDTFSNDFLPKPELLSISIENNKPVYTWTPLSSHIEVHGYKAFIQGNRIAGQVTGRDSFSLIDTLFSGSTGPYSGGIASVDACDDSFLNNNPSFQQTSSFLSLGSNPCGNSINLNWTKYLGWNASDEVKEYQILLTKNSESEKTIGVNDPSVLAYVFSDYIFGDTINLRIRAIHPTNSAVYSHSNSFYLIARKSEEPEAFNILSASYINNYQVKISWYCDPSTRPKSFHLRQIKSSNHEVVRKVSNIKFYAEGNGYFHAFDDNGNSEFLTDYQLEMEDSCNNRFESTIVSTNFLEVEQIGAYKNDLRWPQQFFPDSLKHSIRSRELYFTLDGQNFSKLTDLATSDKSYRHDMSNLVNSDANFCYKIRTRYAIDTSWHIEDTLHESWSQKECIALRTVLWMPNAFKVGGVTPTFKPKLVFFTSNDFSMKIFSRWGQEIFDTSDPNLGWNGLMKNGSAAPEDSYIYLVSYTGNDGVKVTKSGNFILFR